MPMSLIVPPCLPSSKYHAGRVPSISGCCPVMHKVRTVPMAPSAIAFFIACRVGDERMPNMQLTERFFSAAKLAIRSNRRRGTELVGDICFRHKPCTARLARYNNHRPGCREPHATSSQEEWVMVTRTSQTHGGRIFCNSSNDFNAMPTCFLNQRKIDHDENPLSLISST